MSNADKLAEIRKNLDYAEKHSIKYATTNTDARYLLDLVQSIQQERDNLVGILRSTSSDIESAVDLLREDYFENWDESVEILSVARRVIRSNLERIGVGEERT
jgi:hypothetical protein